MKKKKVLSIISSMSNPYPLNVFTGKTKEGKIGQFGHKVIENFRTDLLRTIKQSKRIKR